MTEEQAILISKTLTGEHKISVKIEGSSHGVIGPFFLHEMSMEVINIEEWDKPAKHKIEIVCEELSG